MASWRRNHPPSYSSPNGGYGNYRIFDNDARPLESISLYSLLLLLRQPTYHYLRDPFELNEEVDADDEDSDDGNDSDLELPIVVPPNPDNYDVINYDEEVPNLIEVTDAPLVFEWASQNPDLASTVYSHPRINYLSCRLRFYRRMHRLIFFHEVLTQFYEAACDRHQALGISFDGMPDFEEYIHNPEEYTEEEIDGRLLAAMEYQEQCCGNSETGSTD